MKNNRLDDLIKCNIEISSPALGNASFDSILLVVPEPGKARSRAKSKVAGKILEKTTAIVSADDLLDYGFTVEDTAYKAATVAFSQSPSPALLYVCVRQQTEADTETDAIKTGTEEGETGTDREEVSVEEPSAGGSITKPGATGYEDIRTTLARAEAEISFYGFHLTEFRSPADLSAAVAWAEANEKLFCFEYFDYHNCPITNFSYYRSFGLYSGGAVGQEELPDGNRYAALAWMAKCFGYDPGTETWHLKELATVAPTALGMTEKLELAGKHINTFLRYAGANCTVGGYTLAGEWIDVIRFRDWLKAEIQIRVFNILKTNRKVPYTDGGIALIEGAMESTLKEGQGIGGIAQTGYNSDGEALPGYQVHVPLAGELTEADRKSRRLIGCRFTARLAGAIHLLELNGFLTF